MPTISLDNSRFYYAFLQLLKVKQKKKKTKESNLSLTVQPEILEPREETSLLQDRGGFGAAICLFSGGVRRSADGKG